MVFVVAAFSMVAMNERVGELVVPPATSGSSRDAGPESPAEHKYLQELDLYLGVVIGEGKRLVELGQARSRNVLELGVRMDRFRAASAELRAYVQTHDPPASLETMINELMSQLDTAELAIQASISAIRAFDWDSLGISVDEFGRAVEAIDVLSHSLS